MTIEEAIKLLEIQKPVLGCKEYKKPLMTAYDMAIEALEKQIPKKPIVNRTDDTCLYYENYCPSCENLLVIRYKHCPKCGKSVDWSVEEWK